MKKNGYRSTKADFKNKVVAIHRNLESRYLNLIAYGKGKTPDAVEALQQKFNNWKKLTNNET